MCVLHFSLPAAKISAVNFIFLHLQGTLIYIILYFMGYKRIQIFREGLYILAEIIMTKPAYCLTLLFSFTYFLFSKYS